MDTDNFSDMAYDIIVQAALDIASQGETIEQARDNLQEAPALFFETA